MSFAKIVRHVAFQPNLVSIMLVVVIAIHNNKISLSRWASYFAFNLSSFTVSLSHPPCPHSLHSHFPGGSQWVARIQRGKIRRRMGLSSERSRAPWNQSGRTRAYTVLFDRFFGTEISLTSPIQQVCISRPGQDLLSKQIRCVPLVSTFLSE